MNKYYDQRNKVPDDWSVLPLPELDDRTIEALNLTREGIEQQGRDMACTYLETGDMTRASVEAAVLWIGLKEPRIEEEFLLDYRDLITNMSKKVEKIWSAELDRMLHPENSPERE